MTDLIQSFFGGDGFMPHGMCYLWKPELLWLHVVSDSLVALSYFAIPPTLLFLVVRARRELSREGAAQGMRGLPYDWIFVAFGVFIVACGATHFIGVITVWKPIYWVSGSAKGVTAMASLVTAIALPPLVPRALDLVRAARDNERHRLELEEAHAELRDLYAQLREVNRLRSEQFANVSHELRTPLTLILGPAGQMIESGALPPEHRKRAESIHRNALQLLGRVDDLLDAAMADSGSSVATPADVDVAELVRQTTAHFDELAEHRQIELTVDAPDDAPAFLDRTRTERILLNLLSNAFKFTPSGGKVRVTLGYGPPATDGDTFVLTVEDDGPGVPVEARGRIFDRFFQTESGAHRRFGGTGLGLAIARDFAEIQGGEIEVGGSLLGGALFRVRLPRRLSGHQGSVGAATTADSARVASGLSAVAGEDPPPVAWSASDDRPRVLVVEDHGEMRAYLGGILGEDFNCACVSSGREALRLAAGAVPDLVVTDLMMPGMPGKELVERLRALPGGEDIPIIVLTARSDPELPAQLLRAGAQDFLAKPVRADELIARSVNLISAGVARTVLRQALSDGQRDLPALSTEIARRKGELEAAVQERETLLQELHHRVKGNLQTVASLLSLQLRSLDDEAAREALEDSRSRIRAIALLHDRLYQAGNLAGVEMGGYLNGLAAEVKRAFTGRGAAVTIDVRADVVHLDVERAVACGLVAHELTMNALEHGASPDGIAAVTLSLTRWRGEAILTVEDRGRGMPETSRAGGLGLELVQALSGQLRGALDMENRPGLRCQLRFPLEPHGSEMEA
jgi:signal transduction histidine kinase